MARNTKGRRSWRDFAFDLRPEQYGKPWLAWIWAVTRPEDTLQEDAPGLCAESRLDGDKWEEEEEGTLPTTVQT